MLTQIGTQFPNHWLWGKYESKIITSISDQIEKRWPDQKNLLINLTWFGPQFNNQGWSSYLRLQGKNFDNLFLLATVDPPMINKEQISKICESLQNPRLFKLGNFDGTYHFNFFAPILAENFRHYHDDELKLIDPKWVFINYNRKPRQHRVDFVKLLRQKKLDHHGLITLGKPNVIYDKDPDNDLYLSLGENPEDYVRYGHWYDTQQDDKFGIPHDVLSLHNMEYWQHHFLYIVGATEFNVWDDIFVSEIQFKPIIGLRPFLINGNPRTYQWLVNNGFRTFNHWFPDIDFENSQTVHQSLCQAIENLVKLSRQDLIELYHQMLPDLCHNRDRFYEFAREQQEIYKNLF